MSRPDADEEGLVRALEERPEDYVSRTALADLLVDRGRAEDDPEVLYYRRSADMLRRLEACLGESLPSFAFVWGDWLGGIAVDSAGRAWEFDRSRFYTRGPNTVFRVGPAHAYYVEGRGGTHAWLPTWSVLDRWLAGDAWQPTADWPGLRPALASLRELAVDREAGWLGLAIDDGSEDALEPLFAFRAHADGAVSLYGSDAASAALVLDELAVSGIILAEDAQALAELFG